ncbi:succinylglutamate desuccinylase/aspartoacylase domain-containing protein [Bordetella genomosp. 1]|uniref:Succinylglutamate desuccinylase n=1 Tax=Bordetella genomosp. 1 TaxID=1395607 RepID=A0ABX4F5J5_9BORD|nr:succinylglutamate desuccinylase/aspartoacylase family protein [Bordetella genomosp. 1]OZI69020.1 succinylglutamate desuccinylase [Bordetella genomosp. 1]
MSTAPVSPPLEVLPRDISAYRKGNTGIDYVHRFESGKPGPHVLINALTHGNEICGMVAATHLLDTQVRPRIGTLTVSFAHVEAYEAFDAERPYENRQLVHNLNRIWTPAMLDGAEDSPELRRARELRPVIDAADAVLDIHSTSAPVRPFWVYYDSPRNAALATAVGAPDVHLLMPDGKGPGSPLIGYGRHGGDALTSQGSLVVECGQHFARSAAELATATTLRFLAHFGLIEPQAPAAVAPQRFKLLQVHVVKSEDFRFVRPLVGFETFARDELIAVNGDEEIRALCDDCTIFMPARVPIVGREAVYLTMPA